MNIDFRVDIWSVHIAPAIELAKEKGLKTIAITDRAFSPVSRLVDYMLLSGIDESSSNYYHSEYSHMGESAVIDALLHFATTEDAIAANSADRPEIIFSESKL